MYSKKNQKKIKRMIKNAQKQVERKENKTKEENTTWLRKITGRFL